MNLKAVISFLISVTLVVGLVPATFASTDSYDFTTKGSYNFVPTITDNEVGTDDFVFDEECFRVSSYEGCTHLAALSMQTVLAAVTWYGRRVDKYLVDPSEAYHNIVAMIKDMGFSDVETNKYYGMENLPSSFAVAMGRKTISVKGKKYTLLVVIPRSDSYRQEWAGNFIVGSGDIHRGFKEARDEVLRFVKKYIKDHRVKGDLKIWTTGHSRGGAITNMVGGFLAGGGAGYLGDNVSLAPEDLYCYSFATPRVVKDGASKAEELSVSGPRGGIYAADTEGDAWQADVSGKLDLSDPVYGCIKNYSAPYDLFTTLPPESWGFECYGTRFPLDGSGQVTDEDMLKELETIFPEAYEKYTGGQGRKDFRWKKFDPRSMSIVDDPDANNNLTMEEFLIQRVEGLTANANNNKTYVENGYQDAFKSMLALYGMLERTVNLKLTDTKTLLTLSRIYSAYQHEVRLMKELADSGRSDVTAADLEYDSTMEKADNLLNEWVDDVLGRAVNKARMIYGDEFADQAAGHVDTLKANITQARRLVSFMLFYQAGEKYSTDKGLNNAVTILSNAEIITLTHYPEMYLAWIKALNNKAGVSHVTGEAEYREAHKPLTQKVTVKKLKVKKVKASALRRKSKVVKAVKVSGAKGKVTYVKAGGSKKLKVNKKTGKVTIKKGTRKGRYKVKIKVKAAAKERYLACTKTVKVTVRVA